MFRSLPVIANIFNNFNHWFIAIAHNAIHIDIVIISSNIFIHIQLSWWIICCGTVIKQLSFILHCTYPKIYAFHPLPPKYFYSIYFYYKKYNLISSSNKRHLLESTTKQL
eukprot:188792_1